MKFTATFALFATLFTLSAASASESTRPNVLLIITMPGTQVMEMKHMKLCVD